MKCPSCRAELELDVQTCPYCSKPVTPDAQARPFIRSREYTGVRQQQGRVLVDHDVDEDATIRSEGHDRLKPRSRIDVKGIGTRMDGEYHVASIRHQIDTSDDSGQKVRCTNCGLEYEKRNRFCKRCGQGLSK